MDMWCESEWSRWKAGSRWWYINCAV